MFCDFCEKFESSIWMPFLAGQKILENWVGYLQDVPHWPKILSKLLYLARFSRYKDFCVLHFKKNFENSKWPPFMASEIFVETWKG